MKWEDRATRLLAAPVGFGLVQALLAALCWLVFGYWNAEQAWLLDPAQTHAARVFFFRIAASVGVLSVALLPAIWLSRLKEEGGLDVVQDTETLNRIFAFPRRVAVLAMAASLFLFLFGAFSLRLLAQAPAIEAAKVEITGFLTGLLLGILSYFAASVAVLPLVADVAGHGAVPAARPPFPLTQKLLVCFLAIALVGTGLFGEIALSWAQRSAEARTQETTTATLRGIEQDPRTRGLRDVPAWKRYFAGVKPAPGVSLVLMDYTGRVLATQPEHLPVLDAALASSESSRGEMARLVNASTVLRKGAPRVASSVVLPLGWRLVGLAEPAPAVIADLVRVTLAISIEVVVLSLLIAVIVSRGVVQPLRRLGEDARAFARDPGGPDVARVPTDDEVGLLSHALATMKDDIRSMQSQLIESERKAATAQLLGSVAHEVRNPLFGISTTAAALADEAGRDERFGEYAAVLKRESSRVSRLLEEMLSATRAPSRARGTVRLAPLLDGEAGRARVRFAERRPVITLECEEDLVLDQADEEKLGSVFFNLFENAILSSEAPVRISCRARENPETVEIEIEDDGPGPPPEIRDRIFEPFVSSRAGGTGLGLAICQRTVGEHGGEIALDSTPGAPTRFRITLPRRRGEPPSGKTV